MQHETPDSGFRRNDEISAIWENRKTLCTAGAVGGNQALTKTYVCPVCGARYDAYEEEMTDVNIATELLGDANDDGFDTAIIISGDGDWSGTVSAIRRRYPTKRMIVAFPPTACPSNCLRRQSHRSPSGAARVSGSLLPERIQKPDGFAVQQAAVAELNLPIA